MRASVGWCRSRPLFRRLVAMLGSLACALAFACLATSPALGRSTTPSWVGAWGLPVNEADTSSFQNQTIRVVFRVSFGGTSVRIRLSNANGTQPLTLRDAHVGIAISGATVPAGRSVPLTFGGSSAVTVPVGATVMSDPADLQVSALQNVAVSLYAPSSTGQGTGDGELASYYTASGDHAADTSGASYSSSSPGGYFVTGLDVYAPNDGLIVAFGDSITVGYAANDEGWPYWLASRLAQLAAQGGPQLSIIDMGISGNQVTQDKSPFGVSAEHRLQRDVLDQTGVKAVLMMEGINDIGKSATPAPLLESGLSQIVQQVRSAHAGILLSPLTPAGDTSQPAFPPTYSSPAAVMERHDVNSWIRQIERRLREAVRLRAGGRGSKLSGSPRAVLQLRRQPPSQPGRAAGHGEQHRPRGRRGAGQQRRRGAGPGGSGPILPPLGSGTAPLPSAG